jgi:hypothetical protein
MTDAALIAEFFRRLAHIKAMEAAHWERMSDGARHLMNRCIYSTWADLDALGYGAQAFFMAIRQKGKGEKP